MQKGSALPLVMFAVVLLGIAGFVYASKQSINSILKTPVVTNTSKVYTNSTLGFQFQYLGQDLTVKEDSEQEFNQRATGSASKSVNGNFRKNFKRYIAYEPGKFLGAVVILDKTTSYDTNPFTVWVFDNPNDLTIDEWYKNYWYYPFVWGDFTYTGKTVLAPKDEATISGQIAKSGVIDYQPGKPKFIYLSKDKKMYLFRVIGEEGDKILSTFQFTNQPSSQKLKKCPDEWIVNRMPGIADIKENSPREYFVIDNKRRELSEFDVEWIKSNCSVNKSSPVY